MLTCFLNRLYLAKVNKRESAASAARDIRQGGSAGRRALDFYWGAV